MVEKDILNFIIYHNKVCLEKINNDNIIFFINKYKRLLNSHIQNKYPVEYIKNSLKKLKKSKYINSFIRNQINEFISNDINSSFFNKILSITLLDNYDKMFIKEAESYGFKLNVDKFNNKNIESIEISTFENTFDKDIINLSDFNIKIIKKYILLSNNKLDNSYSINNEYKNISNLDIDNINTIIKTFDDTINKIILFISKIKYVDKSIEDVLNLKLSLLIEIYCKMKKYLLLNSNYRIIYLSILKNIAKINDMINKSYSQFELSVKIAALLRTKRTLMIIADNIKGDY